MQAVNPRDYRVVVGAQDEGVYARIHAFAMAYWPIRVVHRTEAQSASAELYGARILTISAYLREAEVNLRDPEIGRRMTLGEWVARRLARQGAA